MYYAPTNRRQISYLMIAVTSFSLIFILYRCANLFNKTYLCEPCVNTVDKPSNYVESILQISRWRVKLRTANYDFSHSGVKQLEELVMENGGTPIRILIVSTWRTGSSFLGELLSAVPGNLYYFEPLQYYGNKQIKTYPDVDQATRTLKSLFKCNFTDIADDFKELNINIPYISNSKLKEHCKYKNEMCNEPGLNSKFCKLFPFISMKTVRLRLRYIINILEDKGLNNLKVIFLLRDPRGLMNSRRKAKFCRKPDCTDLESVCSDMISDYEAAKYLLQKYPSRLMTVRFEDLVLNLYETTPQLLKFLNIETHDSVYKFLSTHTRAKIGGVFSTFRISQDVAFQWKTALNFSYVSTIQNVCKEAMDLWGFQIADNASHMVDEEFYPLLPYSVT